MKLFIKILILIFIIGVLIAGSVFSTNADQAIIDKMVQIYNLDTSLYTIEITYNPIKAADIDIAHLTLRPLTQKEPLGLFTVLAKVSEKGDTFETGQVRMKIKKFENVLVTTDKLKRYDVLKSNQITLRKMDVTNLREQALDNMDNITGYRAKRNLRKGTIITSGDVELIPDMEIGREALIVYNDGLCSITAPGIALQNGMAGDYIKVKNKATNKIIVARIVDDKTVAVDP